MSALLPIWILGTLITLVNGVMLRSFAYVAPDLFSAKKGARLALFCWAWPIILCLLVPGFIRDALNPPADTPCVLGPHTGASPTQKEPNMNPDSAHEALEKLRLWLDDLRENHPRYADQSALFLLMLERFKTDNYPEEEV